MKKSLLNQAIIRSRRDLAKHPERNNFPHWTFVVWENKIVAIGLNRKCEPDRKYGYHRIEDKTFVPKLHSELDAIRHCNRNWSLVEMINVRLNREGVVRLAMPCLTCRNLISVLGIKRVYFTTESGWGIL